MIKRPAHRVGVLADKVASIFGHRNGSLIVLARPRNLIIYLTAITYLCGEALGACGVDSGGSRTPMFGHEQLSVLSDGLFLLVGSGPWVESYSGLFV